MQIGVAKWQLPAGGRIYSLVRVSQMTAKPNYSEPTSDPRLTEDATPAKVREAKDAARRARIALAVEHSLSDNALLLARLSK